MLRIVGRVAVLLAFMLWAADVAWAVDFDCPRTIEATRCDTPGAAKASCASKAQKHPNGRQLICEYAMLHKAYEGIYAEQQRRLYKGTLRKSDLQAWRMKRDACTTVRCVDELFTTWRKTPQPITARAAPSPPRQPAVAENRSARHVVRAPGVAMEPAPSVELAPTAVSVPDPTPAPVPAAATVSIRDSLQPLPPVAPRMLRKVDHPPVSWAAWLSWLSWLVILLAVAGAFYWLVVCKHATRYLDAAFAGLAWLKTLPALAFILTGLALLNGVLLIVLLGGWGIHLPGIN